MKISIQNKFQTEILPKNCDVKVDILISGLFCYEPSVWGSVGRWYDGLWQFVVLLLVLVQNFMELQHAKMPLAFILARWVGILSKGVNCNCIQLYANGIKFQCYC